MGKYTPWIGRGTSREMLIRYARITSNRESGNSVALYGSNIVGEDAFLNQIVNHDYWLTT